MSHRILFNTQISEDTLAVDAEVPSSARTGRPGQFVTLGIDNEYSERTPLTIVYAGEGLTAPFCQFGVLEVIGIR